MQRERKGMSQITGRSIRNHSDALKLTPLLDVFSTLEAFLGPKAQSFLVVVLTLQ